MNNRERDLLWRDIMERYIADDYTLVETREIRNGVVLAVAGTERGNQYLDIYIGEDYLTAFSVSGYLEGLLMQDVEYWKDMFNEQELQEIHEMYETWSWNKEVE